MDIQIVEVQGNGFVPGVPGQWSNMRLKVQGGEVLESVPIGQPFSDEMPVQAVAEPKAKKGVDDGK